MSSRVIHEFVRYGPWTLQLEESHPGGNPPADSWSYELVRIGMHGQRVVLAPLSRTELGQLVEKLLAELVKP